MALIGTKRNYGKTGKLWCLEYQCQDNPDDIWRSRETQVHTAQGPKPHMQRPAQHTQSLSTGKTLHRESLKAVTSPAVT